MHDGFSTYETWPFECLHCWRVWEEEYVVRHVSDGHGHEMAVWLRGGVPVQPPWSGVSCPGCGCATVKTFPAGYLAHHADIELTAAQPAAQPGAQPGALSPAMVPDSAPEFFVELPPAPRRLPFMLYTVLGISLLLFASFELFALVEHIH